MRKGVSEMLAVVLLIVIVIVSGVALFGLVTHLARPKVSEATFEATLSPGSMTFVIKNRGATAITGAVLRVSLPNGSVLLEATWSGIISPGGEAEIVAVNGSVTATSGSILSGKSYLSPRTVLAGEVFDYSVNVAFANGAKFYTSTLVASE